jgi:membrane fusion protein, multidrug efflux system
MRPLFIVGAIILTLILGKIFFFGKETNEKTPPPSSNGGKGGSAKAATPPTAVDVVIAQESAANQTIFANGTIVPNEEVELKSEVSGRLIKLTIREGSFIQKGQLIAKLKDDDLKAQLKKLELEEALAKQIEARQKKLLDISAISKEEYEISANKVSTLNADKELLKVQLERTELRSPFSGKIGFKTISEGAYITPATIIATLVQTNPVKIDFTIPEKYAQMVHLGQSVTFLRDGSTTTYSAKVMAIDPKINENLRTLTVRAVTSNPSGALLPGMFVKVNLNLGTERSIMIPTFTVVPVLAGKIVYVKKNGQAKATPIKTGLRTESQIQVIEGLQVGDSVISNALMTLKDESPVVLRRK